MACTIEDLVADGKAAVGADKIDAQAVKTYFLALILRQLGGEDLTDICAYAASLRSAGNYADYDIMNANLVAYGLLAQAYGVQEEGNVGTGELKAVAACAHCCDVTPISLQIAEALIVCKISELVQPV